MCVVYRNASKPFFIDVDLIKFSVKELYAALPEALNRVARAEAVALSKEIS